MKVCIHRGARQIGGSCVEIRSQGQRLLLDVGMPLDVENTTEARLPPTLDISEEAGPIAGVAISHPHQDHYGLASKLPSDTTILIGKAAQMILRAAADFTPAGATFSNVINIKNRRPVELGPFRIVPYLMDHSAYDSYAIHVEADGKGLFYTGDLRAHGRKASLFEALLRKRPSPVDALLMEGTAILRKRSETGFSTETNLEMEMAKIFRDTKGMPLVWCSGQNIDRIVTLFRAAKRAGRQLIIDMYTAHILRATGNRNLPQADWPGVRVFLPEFQNRRIKRNRQFDLADSYKPFRIYPRHLAAAAKNSIMLFRPTMQRDVENAVCLDGACLIYSMWDGYLLDEKTNPFLTWLDRHDIPLHKCHTSGHASLKDLRRLRNAFPDALVVPIHTGQPEAYRKLFGHVVQQADGVWWEAN